MATSRIFEDPETRQSANHKRDRSVGDVLRGRRADKESPKKQQTESRHAQQSPLGERQINSPPQTTKVPLKDESSRPTMHKKTASSSSFKSLIGVKSKNEAGSNASRGESDPSSKPKKSKSSTNLAGLLKKRSKKDLKDQENKSPTEYTTNARGYAEPLRTPIWEQFATQPIEDAGGNLRLPKSRSRTIEQEIDLYTPKDYSEFRPPEQRNFHDSRPPSLTQMPPQRPFLHHKNSQGSIFTEDLEDLPVPTLSRPKSRSDPRPSSSSRLVAQQQDSELVEKLRQDDTMTQPNPKRTSRVLTALSSLTTKSRDTATKSPDEEQPLPKTPSSDELDLEFERVLDEMNISAEMRPPMRALKPEVKANLIKGSRSGSGGSLKSLECAEVRTSSRSPSKKDEVSPETTQDTKRSRSRPRSRVFTLSKRSEEGSSPTKKSKSEESTRSRSKSRPKSVDMSTSSRPSSSRSMSSSTSITGLRTNDTATSPSDFIHYLLEVKKPSLIEVGKIHKLRLLLRNESVSWTDAFITRGGMDSLVQLLHRIIAVEWREDHEDSLLHETLLCLKALCTTSLALQKLSEIDDKLFPALLSLLFSEDKKGPSEFSTRAIIISLLYSYIASARHEAPAILHGSALRVLSFIRDPGPAGEKEPLDFITQMHAARPYRVWCKEVVNVTKEVFWIFLHHLNVVPIREYSQVEQEARPYSERHFPGTRAPHPAAPYTGGVEWEATQYLAAHLDLLNGVIASLPSRQERNQLREELRASGWEKCMGGTMRMCKEKFYGAVHEGLRGWVSAAREDGWGVEDVRAGPQREGGGGSPKKSPKKKVEQAPRINLDLDVKIGVEGVDALPLVRSEDIWI